MDGTDFNAFKYGIKFINGFNTSNGEYISLSYTYNGPVTEIEHLVDSSKVYALTFVGTNFSSNGQTCIVELHRYRLQPTSQIEYINKDGFLNLAMTGFLEKDPTKKGVVSPYFKTTKIGG